MGARGTAKGSTRISSPLDWHRGTLKLTNLSLDMSGLYVCAAENQAGSAECHIVLEVHSSEYVSAGPGGYCPCGVPMGMRREANPPCAALSPS